ncbi:MAG: hypothetical protein ACKV2T_17745 [Kofleriaceae bacterium]
MSKIVYWRRELPPLSEQLEGEHEVTASSDKVHYSWDQRGRLWGRCYDSLMEHARERIIQEVVRLGGSCAHVLDEAITSRQDEVAGEFWLVGTFRYVMYVHPAE